MRRTDDEAKQIIESHIDYLVSLDEKTREQVKSKSIDTIYNHSRDQIKLDLAEICTKISRVQRQLAAILKRGNAADTERIEVLTIIIDDLESEILGATSVEIKRSSDNTKRPAVEYRGEIIQQEEFFPKEREY